MSKATIQKYISIVDSLLEKAESIEHEREIKRHNHVSYLLYLAWLMYVEKLILNIFGEVDIFYINFKNIINREDENDLSFNTIFETIVEILKELKISLELGFLVNLEETIISDLFSDFLEMANHFLENDQKDPAALLIGSVLESSLKKIANKHKVTITDNDDISIVSNKLFAKKVFNQIVQKQIKVWTDIRNCASHSRFQEYDLNQVRLMLEGVKNLLAQQFS